MSTVLRDRFFELSAGKGNAEEIARYRAQVEVTDAESTATVDGLEVCWHPTARFKAVRFIDADLINPGVRGLFARPSTDAPYLAAVFADPQELSFRTFENIVPLDRLFEGVPLEADLTAMSEPTPGVFTFSLQLPELARERLGRLDELGLYVPPLNAASRGGQRFIFHSALLAEALTDAVGSALPASVAEGFSHVNPVFRCNRFDPGDARFWRHRDTPYFDRGRGHISRLTMLVYLTGGTGSPALDLPGGVTLTEISELTCVVFDQRFEHEGGPFDDGRKVFVRTELIFNAADMAEDPQIGELFSKACYLTGESVFTPELARHAEAYYNQVAAAHWNGLGDCPARQTFVCKQFRGVHFVANGYDFWFAKTDALSLAECAAITLLDYFNCKLGDMPFRAQCHTEVIEAEDAAWIPAFLTARPSEPAVPPVDKAAFFPSPEQPDRSKVPCCVICDDDDAAWFDTTRSDDVIEHYARAQMSAKTDIMPAPVLMLGEDVVLDPDKFVIRGNLIHVLGRQSLTPVNFASCQGPTFRADAFIDVAATVGVTNFLVPPILFAESQTCYRLRFDFFRNAWMEKENEHSAVSVPMIRPMKEDDAMGEDDWDEDDGDDD